MKTDRITVRLAKEHLDMLEAERKRLGLRGVSELVREALDLYFKSDRPQLSRELTELFQAMRKDLQGVGTNLNQITYRLNAGHPLSSQQLIEALAEVRQSVKIFSMEVKEVRRELDL